MDEQFTVILETNNTERLNIRNHVLATVCGYERHEYVMKAVITVQRFVRGFFRQRKWKQMRRASCIIVRSITSYYTKSAWQRCLHGVKCIQRTFRGHRVRTSPLGKAIQKIVSNEQDKVFYELTILRWSNIQNGVMQDAAHIPYRHSRDHIPQTLPSLSTRSI